MNKSLFIQCERVLRELRDVQEKFAHEPLALISADGFREVWSRCSWSALTGKPRESSLDTRLNVQEFVRLEQWLNHLQSTLIAVTEYLHQKAFLNVTPDVQRHGNRFTTSFTKLRDALSGFGLEQSADTLDVMECEIPPFFMRAHRLANSINLRRMKLVKELEDLREENNHQNDVAVIRNGSTPSRAKVTFAEESGLVTKTVATFLIDLGAKGTAFLDPRVFDGSETSPGLKKSLPQLAKMIRRDPGKKKNVNKAAYTAYFLEGKVHDRRTKHSP